KIDADHTTSLLRNESKRVSIARGPSFQPKYPIAHKRSQSKMLNEGMEALRQIATTSLFMQNEQKTAINRVVPIINEPDSGDAPLEMKKLHTALNACEMSDEEQDQYQDQEQQQQQKQIAKRTTATTAVTSSTTKDPTSGAAGAGSGATTSRITRATTLSTVDEKPDSKLVRQRVALQQQRQQQEQQQHVPKSQSLSSSSTVKDSLEVVEETSLIDASDEATPVAVAVLESSGVTSLSLSLMRPATASGVLLGGLTTSSFSNTTDHQKSHPSSAGSVMGRGSSLLLSPPSAAATSSSATSSKFEPELVLSPAKLGQ
uniref:Uncharacterized protein n=1 Tax=Drosophila rhopaloa TaxID=1041015 RepID=A0A6P4EYH9_DRORH